MKKKGVKRQLWEWAGTLAVAALVLYLFAPASWFQFGVTPIANRQTVNDFMLRPLEGEKLWNFSDGKGKVLVINYWATWCPPCRVETPGFVNIANEYQTRGVEFIGVTVDEDLSLIKPFVESYKIPYQINLPGNDPNLGAETTALPTTFLYDKNGRLAKKYTGMVMESTLRSDIDILVNE